jgi:trehalose 2-sulfotransferase
MSTMPALLDWHPHFGRIGGRDLRTWLAAYPVAEPPKMSIMLASQERTGSEFLCQLMGATSRLGRPSEYLNTYWMRRFIPDFPDNVDDQMAIAHRVGTTVNRCFSMKTHPVHLDRLLGSSSVTAAFPNPVFVRLHRRDLVAQAVSLYRARYSGQYHAYAPADREIGFDGEAIRQILIELARGKARWDVYFARNGIDPLMIAYEDLAANPYPIIHAIASRVGEAVDNRQLDLVSPLQVQQDVQSASWKQRFLDEYHNLDDLEAI